MSLRKTVAATVLSASLLFGGATAALADAPTTHTPTAAQCKAAAHKLAELKKVEAHLKADYAKAVKVRNAAEKAGRTKLVKVLDKRLAAAKARNAKAVAEVKAVAAKVKAACKA